MNSTNNNSNFNSVKAPVQSTAVSASPAKTEKEMKLMEFLHKELEGTGVISNHSLAILKAAGTLGSPEEQSKVITAAKQAVHDKYITKEISQKVTETQAEMAELKGKIVAFNNKINFTGKNSSLYMQGKKGEKIYEEPELEALKKTYHRAIHSISPDHGSHVIEILEGKSDISLEEMKSAHTVLLKAEVKVLKDRIEDLRVRIDNLPEADKSKLNAAINNERIFNILAGKEASIEEMKQVRQICIDLLAHFGENKKSITESTEKMRKSHTLGDLHHSILSKKKTIERAKEGTKTAKALRRESNADPEKAQNRKRFNSETEQKWAEKIEAQKRNPATNLKQTEVQPKKQGILDKLKIWIKG